MLCLILNWIAKEAWLIEKNTNNINMIRNADETVKQLENSMSYLWSVIYPYDIQILNLTFNDVVWCTTTKKKSLKTGQGTCRNYDELVTFMGLTSNLSYTRGLALKDNRSVRRNTTDRTNVLLSETF
jgi:hypothetical protein